VTSAQGAATAELPFRLVLLVGFMASGKSTVGAELASRLGWSFVDLDARIEARIGASVPEIFSRYGEGRFRMLEAEAGREALAEREVVVATGGGWPVAPGRMDGLAGDVFSVWLQVSPGEAVRRARGDPAVRPLLAVRDPEVRAAELLEARRTAYAKARLHLDTGGATPGQIVERILAACES
jgi:shikimate kinase